MELDQMPTAKDRDPRWKLGQTIDRRDLKVGHYIAGLDAEIIGEEYVYAPDQVFETGLLGTEVLPQLRITRRLTYSSMWGSHVGFLFPDTGASYNLHSRFSTNIVNGCQVPEQVTLYIPPEKPVLQYI